MALYVLHKSWVHLLCRYFLTILGGILKNVTTIAISLDSQSDTTDYSHAYWISVQRLQAGPAESFQPITDYELVYDLTNCVLEVRLLAVGTDNFYCLFQHMNFVAFNS